MMSPTNLAVGVFSTGPDLRVRSWDDWLAAATGIPAAAACGQPLAVLLPEAAARGLLQRFQPVLENGGVEVLSPRLHRYLIPCPPRVPSARFAQMQQRVTIAPLREGPRIVGTLVTVEDVTARRERECELAEQMASSDESTRLCATQALAAEESLEAEESLLGAVADNSWRVRQAAVRGLLGHKGDYTVVSLLRALRQRHRDLGVLNSVIQVLAHHGAETLPTLLEFLFDTDVDLRVYAALTLGQQGDLRATPALMAALDDPDTNVRYHVIEALGRLGAVEAVEALVAVAETRDFFLAFPALDALGHIGDRRAAPRLVPLLEDEVLRGPVVEALGRLGSEAEVGPLAQALHRPGTPAALVARALAALYDRYEKAYGEGALIADLARRALTGPGVQNLLDALPRAREDELRPIVQVLGWLEGPAIERTLAQMLGRSPVRKEVMAALVRHGARMTLLLVDQLESQDSETAHAAAVALGRIGDRRAVPALVRVLASREELVTAAAAALARIGDPQAFEPLLAMIGHPDAAVRQAVIAALNSIGHPDMAARCATLLADADPHVRESAIRISGYFGYRECLDPLLACCRDPDQHVCCAAVEHLPYLGYERALPVLLERLREGKPAVRAAAVRALAQCEGPEVQPALLEALHDSDVWVRYFACRSLGRQSSPAALGALAGLVEGDPAPHVRAAAIGALGQIGGSRAVAVLAPLVESEDDDLARAALGALGKVGHPSALAPLLGALATASPERRIDVLRALAQHGGPQAVESLGHLAGTEGDERVAHAAIDALGQLATADAIGILVELCADPERREACVDALAHLGEERAPALAAGLCHADRDVRRAMVEALARMKHAAATEQLCTALDDPEPAVRLEAVTALGNLAGHGAQRRLAALAAADSDPTVRRAARAALRR